MRALLRVLLLCFFAAAGVGLALGLGATIDAHSKPLNKVMADSLFDAQAAITVNRPVEQSPTLAPASFCQELPTAPAERGVAAPEEEMPGPLSTANAAPAEVVVELNPPFAAEAPPGESNSQANNAELSPAASEAAALLDWAAELFGAKNDKTPQTNAPHAAAAHEEIPAGEVVDSGRASADGQNAAINGLKLSGRDGRERLSINIQDADIREVLDLLGKQGNLNILTSKQVQGRVSATLTDVALSSALDAILKSTGLSARREGNFIFVGTSSDFAGMERSMDRVGTRVYRPNYIQASELASLIKPVLTQGVTGVGTLSVTSKAEQGIAADATGSGGDDYAGTDAVVVRDFESVLTEIDQLVDDIDVRPTQVQIEAMILSVELGDDFDFGVSFEVLRQFPHLRFGWGKPDNSLGDFEYNGGLKVAFLDDSLGAFIEALETVGDTDVIGTPRLMVVNKHRAEIQVGESRGYVSTTQTETARTQSVEFLELGILLRIRPFISSDGVIRMEVHPEISDGDVDVKEGFTLPNKQVTQVTTNVMVHDGCTVVIGGLLKEELKIDRTQVPLLGSLPLVGVAFRTKNEELKRRELIVLLTPHIVYEPDTCAEGVKAACEFHRRQDVVREKTSPLGKRSLARRCFRKAQQAWAAGQRHRAMRLAEMAVNFDPNNRAAIDLRSDIWLGRCRGDHTLPPADAMPAAVAPTDAATRFERQPLRNPLDAEQIAPWLLDDLQRENTQNAAAGDEASRSKDAQPGGGAGTLQPIPMSPATNVDSTTASGATAGVATVGDGSYPQHPFDPGVPGRRFDIKRPQRLKPVNRAGE